LGNLGGTDGLSGLASMVGKLTGGKKE